LRALTLHLPTRAADVDRWSRGEAPKTLVKENSGRTIWRVDAGSPAFYVKRFPASLFRDRARKEAAMLQALREAGIPCPRLVATARDDSGSYIVTEEIAPAEILQQRLARRDAASRALLASLGALTRRLHDAGFEHLDFHAGNVLVRGAELHVLDVHRAKHGARVSAARRLDGAAFMAMSFSELVPAADLVRYFRACGLDHAGRLKAWERLRELRHRYYRGRTERCFKEGTSFGRRGRTLYRKEADLDRVLRAVESKDAVVVKESGSERLCRSGEYFLKRTSAARARKIWRNSQGLIVRGLPTPKLWAWGGSWVAGEWIDAPDLYGYVTQRLGRFDRSARDAFLERVARTVRRLHDRGVYHADLKSANVLATDAGVFVVDLDRVRFSLDVDEADRIFNLAQLNASLPAPLTRTDRWRFLRTYMGRCASLRRKERRWIGEIMRLTVKRAHHWPPR